MSIAILFSMLNARTLRNGGEFSGPDYAEEQMIDELLARPGSTVVRRCRVKDKRKSPWPTPPAN